MENKMFWREVNSYKKEREKIFQLINYKQGCLISEGERSEEYIGGKNTSMIS